MQTWRLLGVEQALDEPDAQLHARALERLGLERGDVLGVRIARRALDARRERGGLRFVCHVDVALAGRPTPAMRRAERSGRLRPVAPPASLDATEVDPALRGARVAVVGSGPAGVFAARVLAGAGARVQVLERGARLEERGRRVVRFHRRREPDPETNLLFGEGGAGTYSDGKLYTRVDDPLEVPILEELVACGAPPEILFDGRAHIGTDRLHRLLPRLRARLEELGVEFLWETRLEGLVLEAGPPARVRALRTSRGEIACDALVLATGHSARDTWRALAAQGVPFEAKPFQLGSRVEHPQELVTRACYGTGPEAQVLGAAAYSLAHRAGAGHAAAHSFCMCPGGRIVASVNEPGALCTNGMSNSRHSSRWANAALVTTLGPDDFAARGSSPFAGVELQRELEARFFEAGGGDYTAPAQRVADFLAGRESGGDLASSYIFGARPARLDKLLPGRVTAALRAALSAFERRIPGFAGPQGLFVGIESRSSGPVRIPRDERRRARGFANLFPVGEGAGYAGGITSAAIDGARSALALLRGSAARRAPTHGLH